MTERERERERERCREREGRERQKKVTGTDKKVVLRGVSEN